MKIKKKNKEKKSPNCGPGLDSTSLLSNNSNIKITTTLVLGNNDWIIIKMIHI